MNSPADLRSRLHALALDLRWAWRPARRIPFEMLGGTAWEASRHSPLAALAATADDRLALLSKSAPFVRHLAAAEADADESVALGGAGRPSGASVAYFCSEYAIHESIPQYAGGLGVLAGDHLKQASDMRMPLCAIGLLYGHGYYRQEFDEAGGTRVNYPRIDRATLPIEPTGVTVRCPVGRRVVHAAVWRMRVGGVPLYLLDADLPRNRPEDRELTLGLYRGEPLLRLRQQVLLGVGGAMALKALGERPATYHLNEGHAAFVALELLREARAETPEADEDDLLARVRDRIVFTTHTPVPAGHDRYQHADVWRELGPIARAAGLTGRSLAALGRERPRDLKEPFCMTVLALRACRACNGVATLHGEVSREMWKGIEWGKQTPVTIDSITNGVHQPTWCHPLTIEFWKRECQVDVVAPTSRAQSWERAEAVAPAALWALRNTLRGQLVHDVRERCARAARGRGEGCDGESRALTLLREDALTIGFARRFATYKRAPLIFTDMDRLARILANPARPVQLVFAGKAHPRDLGGQAFAQRIIELSRDPRIAGRVAVVEEYDMAVGRLLTSGADLWLNNPLRPMEASGTSGMKGPLAGSMNLSILDGWWPEAYDGRNGWAPEVAPAHLAPEAVDAHDAGELYRLLEAEIVPLFYERDADGLPREWLTRAAHSAATVGAGFGTTRMLREYAAIYRLTP